MIEGDTLDAVAILKPSCENQRATASLAAKGLETMSDRSLKPPYSTYKSFLGLIEELCGHAVMPSVIDRSFLSKRSGSEQSALIATLKWFDLINEEGAPTTLLRNYAAAGEDAGKELFAKMVKDSYSAVTDGTFALESATTNMLADKFREYGISGSTLSKCISFFLSAAKDAGIAVSPHVKAPPAPKNGGTRKLKLIPATPPRQPDDVGIRDPAKPKPPREGMVAIPIPIFGGKDGVIYLPGQMSGKQWESVIKMTEFILKNYRDTMAEELPSAEEEDGT